MTLREPSPRVPASAGDEETLIPFVRDFYAHFDYPYAAAEKRAALAPSLRSPAVGRIFFVEAEGRPVGYTFLSFYVSIEYGGLTAFVDELYVMPGHRGRGLGTRVLHEVFALAPGLGLRAIHLESERSNTRATALYLRLGFIDHDRKLLTRLVDR